MSATPEQPTPADTRGAYSLHRPDSTSAVRYEACMMELARKRLSECPDYQAEAIAKHYASLAIVAMNLLEMLQQRRYGTNPQVLDDLIDYRVEQIKSSHRLDFGIELEWPNTELTDRRGAGSVK
jgi:hypothetical protein